MSQNHDARDPIFALSDELVEAFAAQCPAHATLAGVPCDDGAWNDWSPSGAASWAATLASFQERLRSLPAPSPGAEARWGRLARRVMSDYLDERLDDFRHGEHLRDLNNIESAFQHLRMVFDLMDVRSAAGWEAVASRLATLPEACERYRASLEEGRRTGQVVARRQVLAVLSQARHQAGEGSFFLTLPAAYEASGVATDAGRARLAAGAEGVRAAFSALAGYLEQIYLPSAREADAVGEERYLRLARRFLGASIDPIETYAWGWSEVHAIEAQMARLAAEIRPGASLPEVIALLKTDPARCAHSADEFLRVMAERQRKALAELDGVHFDIPVPLRQIDVRLAPPGGALGAYYVPPSDGFKRPGTIWYAPGDKQQFPLYDEITTAYHEGFPGHHLQCALQVYLDDRLSRLHRFLVMYSGHAEGWALYAEQLMYELGYFERPEYVLGMLAAKLMRAYRVALDIGMHLELPIPRDAPLHAGAPWSYDIAVEYLHQRAFLTVDHARSEATRYLGWPGQAISYKVGERVVLQLREELRRLQGEAFDLKAFHARVIGSGSVGLDHLREIVLEDAAAGAAG
ncbi:hypothetical protein SOCEGT47_014940 [Sorangium cellulosum]|uniref:DUF885 domain-containing protein n=1 Tax=Sorangium cellulosum TaxID=56 RepID=A0A4P2PWX0_SORCE|nr:DUF885 domain-containing protein [Sorangium cellulosum]AUX21016.1 hypothetical protein SOCEGT47_014940 [Sorangium cellulosum]